MKAVITSELLKFRRTFSMKLLWIMPLSALLLSFLLMGGRFFQFGSFNWWYMFLLPGGLAFLSAAAVHRDKKMKFNGILLFPFSPSRIWLGKVLTGVILLSAACLVFLLGVVLGGYVIKQEIPLAACMFGSLLLFICFAWQIPFCMFLTLKSGIFGTVLVNLFASIGFSILSVADKIWMIPYGIPARLMCPVLKVHPNGIPLDEGNVLLNSAVIFPGVLAAMLMFIIATVGTALYFHKQEAK